MTHTFLAEDFRKIMEKLSDISSGSEEQPQDTSSEEQPQDTSSEKSIDDILVNNVPENQISMRKQIARIIDPAAWSDREFQGKIEQKNVSLSKADDILKIINSDSIEQTDQEYDELEEDASAGATSSGSIATLANPMMHVNRQPSLFGYVEEVKVRKTHNRAKRRTRHK